MNSLDNILTLDNITIGYSGSGKIKQPVFSNINLKAGMGENIALIGKNGIGKSTLLRTIARLQKPLSGNVFLKDNDIKHYKKQDLAKLVSFVSTEIVRVSNLNLFDLVSLGRFPHTGWIGKLNKNDIRIINDSINHVGISHLANKVLNEMSDGERQRAMIARALAQDTEIIILDEPTAFLDLPNRYEIIRLLNELTVDKGKTIIFSSHDLNIALQEADKVWLMENNKIVEGAPEDLIISSDIYRLFENSRLDFDIEKGDFRLSREKFKKINLSGEGILRYWTQRALERIGYEVSDENANNISDENANNISVVIQEDNNRIVWIYIKNRNKINCNSIYELTLHLRKS